MERALKATRVLVSHPAAGLFAPLAFIGTFFAPRVSRGDQVRKAIDAGCLGKGVQKSNRSIEELLHGF